MCDWAMSVTLFEWDYAYTLNNWTCISGIGLILRKNSKFKYVHS